VINTTKEELWDLYKDGSSRLREDERIHLDKQKVAIELEKIALEKKKLAVSLHVEDFKARWQELLNFENENNRWTTLYVTALLIVIGWILNNSEKYNGLRGLYEHNDNAYFVLSIAVINALYTFSMAFKGYQIHQIAQYLYEHLGGEIWDLTTVSFNEWERYRRDKFSPNMGPEPIRRIYYSLIGSLPTVVSYVIIMLYWIYEFKSQFQHNGLISPRNWYSILVFSVVTSSLFFAYKTSSLNARWKVVLNAAEHRNKVMNEQSDANG
jgi:hypothetical protein